jgi:RNA polymerase sigma factor (sigma-70 family)
VAKTKKGSDPSGGASTQDAEVLDLKGYGVRLLAYAHRRARSYRWWHGPVALAKGNEVEDIVQRALLELWKKWDTARPPDPWRYLISTVNSLIWRLVRSPDNRRTDALETADELESTEDSPLDVVLSEEDQRWREHVHDCLLEELLEHEDLLRLHDLAEKEDMHEPRFVAERLGLEVKQVNNMKKRINRIYARVLERVRGAHLKAEGTA